VTRAYAPATRELLGAWHAAGGVPTDAERVVAPGDDEDLEYAALMTAADLASGLGAADGRRVVVVAEATGEGEGALPLRHWVAVHCDVADRSADADPDDDLGWFGVQEIPDLL
jgi:hypothetical protein